MSTEVSVAVKTEGRNHKPGALQRVVMGVGDVKLSGHTYTETTLIGVSVCKGIYTAMKTRAS